jgi:hypothetical protein
MLMKEVLEPDSSGLGMDEGFCGAAIEAMDDEDATQSKQTSQ